MHLGVWCGPLFVWLRRNRSAASAVKLLILFNGLWRIEQSCFFHRSWIFPWVCFRINQFFVWARWKFHILAHFQLFVMYKRRRGKTTIGSHVSLWFNLYLMLISLTKECSCYMRIDCRQISGVVAYACPIPIFHKTKHLGMSGSLLRWAYNSNEPIEPSLNQSLPI